MEHKTVISIVCRDIREYLERCEAERGFMESFEAPRDGREKPMVAFGIGDLDVIDVLDVGREGHEDRYIIFSDGKYQMAAMLGDMINPGIYHEPAVGDAVGIMVSGYNGYPAPPGYDGIPVSMLISCKRGYFNPEAKI